MGVAGSHGAKVDLRSIEIFLAICEEGGFTAAAHTLSVTQAAVSQHITKLERELEVGLIDRGHRPQRLTAAGEHLRRRGKVLLNDLRCIRDELRHYRNNDIPALRLGLIESVAGSMLPLIVQRLGGKIGSLSITSGTTHPLMPELLAGNFDLLVTSEQIEETGMLHSVCLLVEPVILVLPKGVAAPMNWTGVAELARSFDFVRYGTRRRLGRIVNRILERHSIATTGTLAFDSSAALLDRVRAGTGWAATTPMCLLSAGVDKVEFEIAPFPDTTPIRSINAVWQAQRNGIENDLVLSAIRSIVSDSICPQLRSYAGWIAECVQTPEDDCATKAS